MSLVWVIGSGGMLGQALVNELKQAEDKLFELPAKLNWNNPSEACEQLKQAVSQLSKEAGKDGWIIYWAAGTGTMHSNREDLKAETELLETLISSLLNDDKLILHAGKFIFASSAGAIYAGIQEGVITESMQTAPINVYGETKLLQEAVLNKLNQNGQGAIVVTCRITTLYGLKSKDGKQQGLIAEMIRNLLTNQVIHIYVPLETMRDYITPKDAAIQMIDAAKHSEKTQGIAIKIIASGVSTSVAEIIAILKRICKRNLRIVTQADIKGSQYQRAVQFRSALRKKIDLQNRTNLIEGISDLLNTIQNDIVKNRNNP